MEEHTATQYKRVCDDKEIKDNVNKRISNPKKETS